MPSFSDFIVYVDETGDPSPTAANPFFPVFGLTFCLFETERYAAEVAPAMLRFKFKHFGHDQVILHENKIRKTTGAFTFLTDPARRGPFYEDLHRLVAQAPMTLFSVVIRKGGPYPGLGAADTLCTSPSGRA